MNALNIISFIKKRLFLTLLLSFVVFLVFTTQLYLASFAAYGCFDDCFNYGAGYFLGKGKKLYSEIYFNHQMLMAYISFAIQKVFQPQSLYHFILFHKGSYLFFSFISCIFLAIRFRFVGIGFAIIFELSKYYIFGDRFLAESFIVYPFVYLFLITWSSIKGIKISFFDLIFSGVLTWFIIFMREPYIPAAFLLYAVILVSKSKTKQKIYSVVIFFILSCITIASVSFTDYYFNVITVNLQTILAAETKTNELFGIGFVKIFLYPLYLLFFGKATFFRVILIGIDVLFIVAIIFHLFTFKNLKAITFIVLSLGLLNIRFVEPGSMYFESFHSIAWYGVFITTTLVLIHDLYQHNKKSKLYRFFLGGIFLIIGIELFSPSAFQYHQVEKYTQFNVSYGQYYTYGEVIKQLSSQNDTLFVDGFDELIYTQADIISNYPYSWYTSFMPYFEKYRKAREEMFLKDPPDFYYGMCPHDIGNQRFMPDYRIKDYEQVYFAGRLTCLFIHKNKIPEITNAQWDRVKRFEFYLPKRN